MDREGRYILVSQAGAKALGFAPNDMVGETWQELNFSLDVMALFDIKMRTVFASRSGSNGELLFPTTGGIRYFSYHIAPLQSGVGDIEGVVVTLLDITKRRRFEIYSADHGQSDGGAHQFYRARWPPERYDQLLKDIIKADAVVILLRDDNLVRVRATVGAEEDVDAAFSIKVGEGFAGTIIKTAQPMSMDNAWQSSLVENPMINRKGIRQMLGVPLLEGKTVIGVLHVDWFAPHRITEREMNLLLIAAERCSSAIVNARLHEEAKVVTERAELYIYLLTHDINNLNAATMGYVQLVLDRGKIRRERTGTFDQDPGPHRGKLSPHRECGEDTTVGDTTW